MVSTGVLAPELLELIIDNFDVSSEVDRAIVATCSYTSQELRSICQKRLFSDVHLSLKLTMEQQVVFFAEDTETAGWRFRDLLDSSPHLAEYVRSLTITFKIENPLSPVAKYGDALSNNPTFPLYAILPRLSNLEKLAIKNSSLRQFLPWWMLEHRIQDFLIDTVQRLSEVDLTPVCGVPTVIFARSSLLKSLRVSKLSPISSDVPVAPETKVRLESLEIFHLTGEDFPGAVDPFSWFSPPSCPLDISHLVSLQLTTPKPPDLARFLTLFANNLQVLDMTIDSQVYGKSVFSYGSDTAISHFPQLPFELDILRNLRKFTIRAYIENNPTFSLWPGSTSAKTYSTNIPYVGSIIKTLPRNRSSKTLRVTLIIQIINVPESELLAIAWSKLLEGVMDEAQLTGHGITLELELQTFENLQPIDHSSDLLRHVWDHDKYLSRIREKGLIQISL